MRDLLIKDTYSGDELEDIRRDAREALARLDQVQRCFESKVIRFNSKFDLEIREALNFSRAALEQIDSLTQAIVPF